MKTKQKAKWVETHVFVYLSLCSLTFSLYIYKVRATQNVFCLQFYYPRNLLAVTGTFRQLLELLGRCWSVQADTGTSRPMLELLGSYGHVLTPIVKTIKYSDYLVQGTGYTWQIIRHFTRENTFVTFCLCSYKSISSLPLSFFFPEDSP